MDESANRKNIFYSLLFQTLSLLIGFVIRKLLISKIGVYLIGVNGVYENIISMLSLTNFGVLSASSFYLYRAFAHKNFEEVVRYYQAFKKLYQYVAVAIAVLGAVIILKIDWIINIEDIGINYLRLFFLVHLLRVIAVYLVTCPRNALQCDEKRYYNQKADIAALIVFGIIKAFALIRYKSYIIYLLLSLAEMLSSNAYIYYCFRKQYKDIDFKTPVNTDSSIRDILSYGKNLAINNINYFINNCTDNLVISRICGTVAVGLMSNYYLIVDAVKGLTTQLFSSIEANIIRRITLVSNNKDEEAIYSEIMIISFAVASFAIIFLYALTDMFIRIYFGDELSMGSDIAFLMSLNLALTIFQYPSMDTLDAKKLSDKIVIYSTLMMVVNVSTSIYLAYRIGPKGVLFGTILANIILLAGQDFTVFKYVFPKCGRLIRTKAFHLFLIGLEYAAVYYLLPKTGDIFTWILTAFKCFALFVLFMIPVRKQIYSIFRRLQK